MGRPLILSASRRTDLPGFYPKECARRIRDKISRLRTRYLYGVVFWTRHISPFLKDGQLNQLVLREIKNPVINLTVTGLGGSPLEPGCPNLDDLLPNMDELVSIFHGEPWRIRWRFDPLILGHTTIELFERIGHSMSNVGIETCTFSFPSYFSLKGDLSPQFASSGIPKWHDCTKKQFIWKMAESAEKMNIRLLTCNQPENTEYHPSIQQAQCIPKDVLQRGHPEGLTLDLEKDRSQRKNCNCPSSDDLGVYETDICGGKCAYCYSKAGGPNV